MINVILAVKRLANVALGDQIKVEVSMHDRNFHYPLVHVADSF